MVWITLIFVLRSDGKIEYMVDFLCKALPNPVSKIGFEIGIEMAKVSKAKVFSNYFEIVVHNPEIVHKDIASYWVDEATMALLELDSLHYPFGKLPLTLVTCDPTQILQILMLSGGHLCKATFSTFCLFCILSTLICSFKLPRMSRKLLTLV